MNGRECYLCEGSGVTGVHVLKTCRRCKGIGMKLVLQNPIDLTRTYGNSEVTEIPFHPPVDGKKDE